ncbi:MAG: phosphate acyltransferase PlsX [Arenicellales bacterium]|jgi:glycerol-3-phosphate acyltransferase PlsX
MINLSVDAMGGDHGLNATVPASIEVVERNPDVKVILVGDSEGIRARLGQKEVSGRIEVQSATEVVEMEDSPAYALRNKKDSSMRVAINLVKAGAANACVSAGNTGALMATARFVLKTIPGIERPAICAALPKLNGFTYMLDLGANIDSPPENLFQFGLMGSRLISCLGGPADPTVGLLNIGVEEMKGNETIKAAAEIFRQSRLNYKGFVEPDEIYLGDTDLVVCDGFVGNIALKASEGVAQMIMGTLKEEFTRSLTSKMCGLFARPVLNSVKTRLDHRRYNGASLLGLRGTVVKSHGGTDHVGFRHAIEVAIEEVRKNLVSEIENSLTSVPVQDTLRS